MDNKQVKIIFQELKNNLMSLSSYHSEKYDLYKGNYTSSSIKLLKDSKIDSVTSSRIGWAGTAVDYYLSDLQFDAFDNDVFGNTKILLDAGGDEVLYSAIKNSLIGAVSFIASFPTPSGIPINVPYTGAEATGVYDKYGKDLKYGIAIKKFNDNGFPIEWYFFLPGWILVLNNSGDILESFELSVNKTALVDFVYNRDFARRPFGNSIYNISSIKALSMGLRSLKLAEQIGIANLIRSDILLTDANPEDLGTMEFSGAANSLKVMFLNSVNGVSGSKFESFEKLTSSDIQNLIILSADLFSSALKIPNSVLGVKNSTGNISSETIQRLERPYNQNINLTRLSFGDSIKRLSVLNLELATGSDDNDFGNVIPVFKNNFNSDRIGKIGDAIQKIGTVIDLPDNFNTFISREIGLPLRPEVLNVSYPSFNVEKSLSKNYENIKNSIIEEDGKVFISKDNLIEGE